MNQRILIKQMQKQINVTVDVRLMVTNVTQIKNGIITVDVNVKKKQKRITEDISNIDEIQNPSICSCECDNNAELMNI